MNKKGSILDWFLIIAIVMLISITIFAVFIITDKVANIEIFQENAEANRAVQISRTTILNFDNMMMFIIVGLSLFVIISSAMVYNHPAFFILSFILLCVAITFAAVISNAFWDFRTSSTIASVASHFPKIKFLMDKLPFYILFMGMTASIVGFISFNRQ